MKHFVILPAILSLICLATPAPASQRIGIDEYRRRMEESPLHQRAVAVGGKLHEVQKVAPEALYPDLTALANASDAVFLVHIVRNSCTLSPSGTGAITQYKALVLTDWKGLNVAHGIPHEYGVTVDFSVPGGVVSFEDHTGASVSVDGFRPLQDGGRYIVFLRFARGQERQSAPALQLTGGGVQGAFGLEEETIRPAYSIGAPAARYMRIPVSQFRAEVESVLRAEGVGFPSLPAPPAERMDSLFLSPWHLEALGMHLPSYMPSVRALMRYQDELVEIGSVKDRTIEWDSLPGHGDVLGWVEASKLPLAPNFTLIQPTEPYSNNRGRELRVFTYEWVIVATAADGEVRGLRIAGDPRVEGGGEGQMPAVHPKVKFNVAFPDDPQITRITFLWPAFGNAVASGLFALKEIGRTDLAPISPANPRRRPQVGKNPGSAPIDANTGSRVAHTWVFMYAHPSRVVSCAVASQCHCLL